MHDPTRPVRATVPAGQTSRRLWIVIPMYFDTEPFLELRRRILDVLSQTDLGEREPRFIVIDDSAGQDPMVASLREFEDVELVEPPFNLGHQRAIVHALRTHVPPFGQHDLVVTMDADGEDQPEDLPRLIAAVEGHADYRVVAIARRTQRQESWIFRLFYLLFRACFRLLTGTVVRSGNYAVFRGALVNRIIDHPSFNLSYSSTLIGLNLPLAPVPCARGTRYAGRSRMNFSRLILHGLSMLMPFTDRIAIRALLSLVTVMVVSLVGVVVVLVIKLLTSAAIPGWATSSLLALSLLSVLSAGNVVVLLVVFSQSRGTSLGAIERIDHDPASPGPGN